MTEWAVSYLRPHAADPSPVVCHLLLHLYKSVQQHVALIVHLKEGKMHALCSDLQQLKTHDACAQGIDRPMAKPGLRSLYISMHDCLRK